MNAPGLSAKAAAPADATFHAGEMALQTSAGSREVLAEHGARLMRDYMPDQHRQFFTQLPFMVVGGLDASGQPWATIWSGPPGFVSSPDPQHLVLRPGATLAGDPLSDQWHAGAPIALLGIEPHTRRRNRANGRLQTIHAGAHEIQVRQSFGNCPKYIVPRRAHWAPPTAAEGLAAARSAGAAARAAGAAAEAGSSVGAAASGSRAAAGAATSVPAPSSRVLGPALDAASVDLIARADTFFIASTAPGAAQADAPVAAGVDVSHRAGPAGFVSVQVVDGAVELTIPDYVGNRFFNTLGNLLLEPRAGLVFIDYSRGNVLWITGLARIDEDAEAVARVQGALRLLRIRVTQGVASNTVLPLRWA